MVTPHVHGGDDDETDFAIAIMESVKSRPLASKPASVEIHTDGLRNTINEESENLRYANVIYNKIARDLGPGYEVTITLWPKILHRYIIAGDITQDADGRFVKKPRWAIAMNHIARKGDQHRNLPPADWKLLKNERLRDLGRQFCTAEMPGHLVTRTFPC